MKTKIKLFSILFILVACIFCFSGCQSTDKNVALDTANNKAYLDYGNFSQASFKYNQERDETKVIFNAMLLNDTIYNINSFSIEINLNNDSNFVDTKIISYNLSIKRGKDYTGNFNFYVKGEIDSIEFVSWTANYDSFWKTYYLWFVISIILVVIAAIIYIFFMIIDDLDIDDTIWFFEDNLWVLFTLITLLGVFILSCGIILSNWVPVLIVLGAIVSFVLIYLIAHLVKYIIDEIIDVGYYSSVVKRISQNDNNSYNKDDEEDDYDKEFEDSLDDDKTDDDFKKEDTKIKTINKKSNSLKELDKLIGLESVKNQLKRIRAVLLKNKDSDEALNLHMCFYGNPGTGKTVVARLMANIFYEAGILPTNKLIETDRSGLCAQYIGQTAPLTHKKVKEAMGGVLFIDEAYTLSADSSKSDFGAEAIAALLKDMEDYKGKFCVILAGYKDEMEKMIALNPGFDSRINRKIDFPDYSIEEQLQIFNIMLSKKKYEITDEAKNKLLDVFKSKTKAKNFANARTIRNILENLIEIQAVRTIENDDLDNADERIIRIEDVEQYIKEQN